MGRTRRTFFYVLGAVCVIASAAMQLTGYEGPMPASTASAFFGVLFLLVADQGSNQNRGGCA